MENGYIALSVCINAVLLFIGFYAINNKYNTRYQRRNKQLFLLCALLLWQVYILIIGKSGVLQNYSLPPRVLLLCILPAFLFTGIFLYTQRHKFWITSIPPHWLILYQVFRVVIETLFVYSVAKGILPKLVSIQGYNFDMVFALTAPIVAYLLYANKNIATRIVIVWNYAGLAVIASIIFLFVSSIYFPHIYGSKTALMPKEFGLYPYPLVPSFLMPSAVFMHILSLMQLHRKQGS